ncbi:hypothetical protein HDU82_004795 [Entophlyctis luteolus]|nr:hypothetical protein HDU82_004795 [Entophlyctis luteolus]
MKPAPLIALPDKLLVGALRYCSTRDLVRCRLVCLRLRHLVEAHAATLWRNVVVSGHAAVAAKFIVSAVLPKASLIRSLSFESISFALTPPARTVESIVAVFFAAVEELFSRVGPNLCDLRLDNSTHGQPADVAFKLTIPASTLAQSATYLAESHYLFGHAQMLIAPLGKHCPNIKSISLSSDSDENVYIGDANLLLLMQSCPEVETFIDDEPCGITATALTNMVDNWKNLSSLEIDTDCMSVEDFHDSVSKFGGRLKRLSIMGFADPFDDDSTKQLFLDTLRSLENLEVLAINHSKTHTIEGIDPDIMKEILDACPKLYGFEYFPTIESYFDFDDGSESHSFDAEARSIAQSSTGSWNPQALVSNWKAYKETSSTYAKSRRNSVGSMSMATRFGRFANETASRTLGLGVGSLRHNLATLSVFSREDDAAHDDVTSLAPAMPSPNDNTHRVEFYGMWMSGDKLTIRERALRILGFADGGDFFVGKQEVFFAILDGVHAVCRDRGVRVTFAWSI